jgi:S-adenosylmethionine/arginine decarboxylase-like enzyme
MNEEVFGFELILDCYDCDITIISSKEKLEEYARKLCEVIDMKPYGNPIVEYFGLSEPHTKGYSIVQLIETSSITGHFSEYWGNAYINIFSCKPFEWERAEAFTKDFFGVEVMKSQFLKR